MTAAAGILRSNPRYSSSASGAAKSDAAAAAASPSDDAPSSGSSGGTTPQYPLRSLADLAQRSADLSAEASENAGDADSGNVVSSHRSKGGDDANNTHMSALLMTEEGVPYLQDPAGKSGPPVVDANGVIAVGVMGEDGEQVRFCEYDGEPSGDVQEDTASSRDRLGQRMEAEDDVEYEDVREHGSDSESGSSDGDHDEQILEELGLSELMCDSDGEDSTKADESEQQSNAEEVRAFRILWELLTQRWATPATVELVLGYQGKGSLPPGEDSPTTLNESKSEGDDLRTTVDIGASRVAAIMSMMRMNIARSLSELKKMQSNSSPTDDKDEIDQRKAEHRLAALVGTFDPAAPAANLKMKMWKGLTTILVAIAFPSLTTDLTSEDALPPSVRPLKLSAEEYRYLTQSAIASMSSTG